MSVMFFDVRTWGKLGAAAIMRDAKRETLADVAEMVLDFTTRAAAANARAFRAVYGDRHGPHPAHDEKEVREAMQGALRSYPAGGYTRADLGFGGGVGYNCDEDPEYDLQRVALSYLDGVLESLPDTRPAPKAAPAPQAAPPRLAEGAAEITPSAVNPENVEVRFASKPGEEVRGALKAAGYKWLRREACWYGPRAALPALCRKEG